MTMKNFLHYYHLLNGAQRYLLFFIYKKSPVDPDVSLSTANGLGGIDMFNYPSARTYGLNIKLNL